MNPSEDFVSLIWQFQFFEKSLEIDNTIVYVFNVGTKNAYDGPDFIDAKLKLGSLEWNGAIEIHVNASDWNKHNHQFDKRYNSVVLHIVWNNDKVCYREDGTLLPCISIKEVVSPTILQNYKEIINEKYSFIPCEKHLVNVGSVYINAQLSATFVDRIYEKAEKINKIWNNCTHDWDETCYKFLLSYFGFGINNESFKILAEISSYKTIQKISTNHLAIEAYLLGIAGLLPSTNDNSYIKKLGNEYQYLKQKFEINNEMRKEDWKFLRIRPSNFPTIRLAQFADFMFKFPRFFSILIESNSIHELKALLEIEASAFWNNHYNLLTTSENTHSSKLGKSSIDSLLINVFLPIRAAYFITNNEYDLVQDMESWYELISSEKNAVLDNYKKYGIKNTSAFTSQALLGLYKTHCNNKKCLNCSIGIQIINKK